MKCLDFIVVEENKRLCAFSKVSWRCQRDTAEEEKALALKNLFERREFYICKPNDPLKGVTSCESININKVNHLLKEK